MKIAYVFLNGQVDNKDKKFYKSFIEQNIGDVFCADGGANLCYALNFIPKEIWGDLDSINKEVLSFYREKSVVIKKFSSFKDKTDSELILDVLENQDYDKIYCIAPLGGAIEHELTNINLMFKYKNLVFLSRKEEIFRIEKEYLFENLKNRKISFIIYSEKIENLSLNGFRYNLDKENFKRGDSTLISNIIVENIANIKFSFGELLCVLKK